MKISSFVLLIVLVIFVKAGWCDSRIQMEADFSMAEHLLRYDDLVFIGSVNTAERVQSTHSDWGYPEKPDEQLTTAALTFDIDECLKGTWPHHQITIYSYDHSLVERVAGRVVVSASFSPRAWGGSYVIRDDDEVLLSTVGDYWMPLSGDSPIATQRLREVVRSVAPFQLAVTSDLVVEAYVVAINDTATAVIGSTQQPVTRVRVRIADPLVGAPGDTLITFVMPRQRPPKSPWANRYPRKMEIGQKWILFLKRSSFGWYPAEGLNGMLRIRGDEVIYDDRSVRSNDAREFKRAIKKAVEHE